MIYTQFIIPEGELKTGDALSKSLPGHGQFSRAGTSSSDGIPQRGRCLEPLFLTWFAVSPDHSFIYTDDSPPLIEAVLFLSGTDPPEQFTRSDTTTVRGEVDIVVGMRDPTSTLTPKRLYMGPALCQKRGVRNV